MSVLYGRSGNIFQFPSEEASNSRIKLTKPQARMLFSNAKFPLFCGGYGSGKTETLVSKAVKDLQDSPGSTVAIYAPTFDQFKLNLSPRFTEILKGYPRGKINLSDMTFDIPMLGRLIFRSLNNPDRIIGYEVYRSHIDEIDTLPTDKAEDVWNKIVARNRAHGSGPNRVSAYTTPEGFKFCYQRWVKDQIDGYALYRAPTYSNPYLDKEYVETLKASYPPQLVEAYIEGYFVNMTSGRVWYYDRNEHASTELHDMENREMVRIGMDFNVDNMSAVVYVLRPNEKKTRLAWHAVDELVRIKDTPAMIEAIKEKYQSRGCKVRVYPDATGDARKTVGASKSDISLLKLAGFEVLAKSKNPFVRDRVISTNQALSSGMLFVNEVMCPETASDLEQQVYDGNGMPDKSSGNDHRPDAFSYPIVFEMPVVKPLSRVQVHGA